MIIKITNTAPARTTLKDLDTHGTVFRFKVSPNYFITIRAASDGVEYIYCFNSGLLYKRCTWSVDVEVIVVQDVILSGTEVAT